MPSSSPTIGVRPQAIWDRVDDDTDIEARRTLQEAFDENDPVHMALEQQWLTNIAYLTGYQYHSWDDAYRGLVYQEQPGWRVREVRNIIRPHAERRIAYLTQFQPKYKCRPNSTEIEDDQAARKADAIVPHYYNILEMGEKLHELAYWMVITGNGFLRIGFDKTAGTGFTGPAFGEDGQPLRSEDGKLMPELYFTGDIFSDVVSPFSVYVPPLVSRPEDLDQIVIRTQRPISWVAQHFGEDVAAEVTPDDETSTQTSKLVLSLIGPGSMGAAPLFGRNAKHRWCTVTEYWQMRSSRYPAGRLIMEAGGKVLMNGPNPMPDGELPIIWFRDMVVPGRAWGQSFVDNLILPQRNYNRLASSVLEHIYSTCHAKVLEPGLSGIEESAWITEHGEHVKYWGTEKPSYLEPPSLPSDYDKAAAQIQHDMDMTALSFGASRGQYQGKISGAAINLLIEQDLQSKEPQIARMARGLEKWARKLLKLVQQNIKVPTIVKITGADGALDIDSFVGADLRGNFDVVIDVGQMMPKSRTLALQMIQTLTGGGLLNPMNPRDKAAAFKMLDQESPDPIIQDANLDRHGAQIEDKWMLQGIPAPPAQYFEDQDLHIVQHTTTMKTDRFKMAPPQVQMLFQQHVASHYAIAYPQVGATVPQGQIQAADQASKQTANAKGGDNDGDE